MTDTTNGNGGAPSWNLWSKHVLISLEELKKQNAESEDKIDNNKDLFIKAINSLELTITKEMGELRSEYSVLKTRFAVRTVAWSSIIPGIAAAVLLILKFFN